MQEQFAHGLVRLRQRDRLQLLDRVGETAVCIVSQGTPVVIGQGAVALNEMVPAVLAKVVASQPLMIRHQAGKKNHLKAAEKYQSLGVDAEVLPFIDDMAAMYAWADIVVCRSGALTVSELAAAGVAEAAIKVQDAVQNRFGIELVPEPVWVGFGMDAKLPAGTVRLEAH